MNVGLECYCADLWKANDFVASILQLPEADLVEEAGRLGDRIAMNGESCGDAVDILAYYDSDGLLVC